MSSEFVPFEVVRPISDEGLAFDLCTALPHVRDLPVASRLAQTVTRELRKLRLSTTRFAEIGLANGLVVDVDLHDDFGAKLAHGYFQEASDWNIVSRLTHPGDVAIDVGANVGIYALELARRCGANGLILALEPNPALAAALARAAQRNGTPSLGIVRAAASDTAGTGSFFVSESASLSGIFRTSRSPLREILQTQLLRLDDLPELAGREVNFVKIDAEGAESEVLMGAQGILDRSPEIVLMVEYSIKNLSPERHEVLLKCFAQLVERGFNLYAGDLRSAPTPLHEIGSLRAGSTGNIFLCRAGSAGELRFLDSRAEEAARTVDPITVQRRLTSALDCCLRLAAATLASNQEGACEGISADTRQIGGRGGALASNQEGACERISADTRQTGGRGVDLRKPFPGVHSSGHGSSSEREPVKDVQMKSVLKRIVQGVFASRGYQISRIIPNMSLDASDSLMRFLRANHKFKTIVDIGAHDGAFLEFLQSYFRSPRSIAFEPLASARTQMEKRNIPGITIFPHALSDTSGTASFNVNAFEPASSMLPVSALSAREFPQTKQLLENISVPMGRLDDLIDADTLEPAVFLKMDVQGVEDRVISGGKRVISKADIIMIEVSFRAMYEGQALFEEVHAPLAAMGFRLAGIKNQISGANGEPLFGHFVYCKAGA